MGDAHTEIAATRYGTTYGKASTILAKFRTIEADHVSFVRDRWDNEVTDFLELDSEAL